MKSIYDYSVDEGTRTPRLEEFIAWVEKETAISFSSKRAKEAFELGLILGVRGYVLFQQSRRESSSRRAAVRGRAAKSARFAAA